MNITNISPYAIYKPISGGRLRIYNLNLELSKLKNNVSIFTQDILNKSEIRINEIKKIKINEKLIEYRFINIFSLIIDYLSVNMGYSKIFCGDILKIFKPNILNDLIKSSDIIQVEHPWQFEYVYKLKYKLNKNIPIIFDGQNVEYNIMLQRKMFFKKVICDHVFKKEKFAVENADVVFMVSEEDKNRIIELYNIAGDKIHVIPNGTVIPHINMLENYNLKEKLKQNYGYENKKIILFVGSKFLPNLEAVNEIIKISKHFKDNSEILFVIVGNIYECFEYKKYNNVIFVGRVDNIQDYFLMADIAINPMLSGSGTNIKMLEYMSYRLPIISTKIGARGIEIENRKSCIISSLDEFPFWIETLLEDDYLRNYISNNARKIAEEKYDWKVIAKKVDKIYGDLLKKY